MIIINVNIIQLKCHFLTQNHVKTIFYTKPQRFCLHYFMGNVQFRVVITSDCMCVGNDFKSKVPGFNLKEFFHNK